jgi:N-acetylglucosamine-6-phosphate deacetylase
MQLTPFHPIDFHCHGIGKFDFAEPDQMVLDELETVLRSEGVRSILTLYLPRSKFAAFEAFVAEFDRGRRAGRYTHVLGIALEGPMLASFGGTPEKGCWQPDQAQWARLAALGPLGLIYVVLSPDAILEPGPGRAPSVQWIADALLDGGVKPALGHFRKDDPRGSARAIAQICEHAWRRGAGPLFTDHLFNDMPLLFKHSWRSAEEKRSRSSEVPAVLACEWTDDNLDALLGVVPAALIRYAKRDMLRLCMNFDGEHVDIEICRRAVSFIGAHRLMLMTDRIQSGVLGGQALHRVPDNDLLYQSGGVVAGGTQSVIRQIGNMLSVGLTPQDILHIASATAQEALGPLVAQRAARQPGPQASIAA